MKKYENLVKRLRAVESRSKRELLDEAADAIEQLSRQNKATVWRRVEDELPSQNGTYLCCYHFDDYREMKFFQALSYYATDPIPHFQHEMKTGLKVDMWAPLPHLPEKPVAVSTAPEEPHWLMRRFLKTE